MLSALLEAAYDAPKKFAAEDVLLAVGRVTRVEASVFRPSTKQSFVYAYCQSVSGDGCIILGNAHTSLQLCRSITCSGLPDPEEHATIVKNRARHSDDQAEEPNHTGSKLGLPRTHLRLEDTNLRWL